LPKIRELDALISREDNERVIEAHPECSFALLNGGTPLASKHTRVGVAERVALIEREFGVIPARLPRTDIDDVLDAYAVLWTAERFARGVHQEFPAHREVDADGRAMRIVV